MMGIYWSRYDFSHLFLKGKTLNFVVLKSLIETVKVLVSYHASKWLTDIAQLLAQKTVD